MEALIAFILLGVVVTALIEMNERIKAKRPKQEVCSQKETGHEDCSSCELMSVCEKEEKPTAAP